MVNSANLKGYLRALSEAFFEIYKTQRRADLEMLVEEALAEAAKRPEKRAAAPREAVLKPSPKPAETFQDKLQRDKDAVVDEDVASHVSTVGGEQTVLAKAPNASAIATAKHSAAPQIAVPKPSPKPAAAFQDTLKSVKVVVVEDGVTSQASTADDSQADYAEDSQADYTSLVVQELTKLEHSMTTISKMALADTCRSLRELSNELAASMGRIRADVHAYKLQRLQRLSQKLPDAIAEYNKAMPGWEVPVGLQVRAEQRATMDDAKGSKVVVAPNSKQGVSSQALQSNGVRVENVSFIKSDTLLKPKADPATWPAVRSGEIELMLENPLSILPTRSVCSPSLTVGKFRFKILVFPRGRSHAGKHLGAFVLAEPGDVDPDYIFKNVKLEITMVNWTDFTRSQMKSGTFTFKASGLDIDHGWHDLVAVDSMTKSDCEWVGPTGSVCVRARCRVPLWSQGWSDYNP